MANGIRTGDPYGFNKGRSSKFREGSRVRQTPEEGQRTYRPKRCGNNNKVEDNSPKTLNDIYISKVIDRSRGRQEGSLFNSYYTELLRRAQLLCLYCFTLPLIHTIYC